MRLRAALPSSDEDRHVGTQRRSRRRASRVQHLQLHAAFRAGLRCSTPVATNSAPGDQVGGQANFDDRRRLHAQARRIDRASRWDACRTAPGSRPQAVRSSWPVAALRFRGRDAPAEQRPAQRGELAIAAPRPGVFGVGRRPATSAASARRVGELLLLSGARRRLPAGQQRAARDHRPASLAVDRLGVEVPDVLVAEAVGVRIAGQHVARHVARSGSTRGRPRRSS